MLKFRSHFQKLLALSLVLLSITSCDPGCVEAYQFDAETKYVDAKPISDGIFGDHYDDSTGGEIAGWKETGLKTNGAGLVFQLSGAWTAWSDASNDTQLAALPRCTMCFKRSGVSNCICEPGQNPQPERDVRGNILSVDCSVAANQNDPSKCTCTRQSGTINDMSVYGIALNYQGKDEVLKIPDEQDSCRYDKGIGLYIGLFGRSGFTMPLRVYHMYPTEEICDITRNIDGDCVDEDGADRTKYVYRSPNNKIFVKDDLAGNNGSDTNHTDDLYHAAGEYIKFIINDRYYSDNYGGYNIDIMGGFLRNDDNYLIEYIVRIVEDSLFGKVSEVTGKRENGMIEFMYNAIIKDSVFILIVQLCLTIYIVVFGVWVLAGALEISRKELSMRIFKIGLVILFTTQGSWYFYNQIVVGLFKDSMDYVISIFMNASDSALDTSSLVINAQMDRASDISNSTRFSYVDVLLRKLYSAGVAKKVLGLVFGDFFGFIYAPVIYLLIFGFTYVMVFAALMYVKMIIGLVFALCLGPIFMMFILFSKTQNIFKRWLAYVASQSLQIIGLFLIVYMFAVIIDRAFNDMLYYRACTVDLTFGGLFNIPFLVAEIERPMAVWFLMFLKIAALLLLMRMIMEKIPGVVGSMVVIMGQKADNSAKFVSNTGNYAASAAKSIFGEMRNRAIKAWNKTSISGMWEGGRQAIRATGLGQYFDKISNVKVSSKIPERFGMARNAVGIMASSPMTNWNNSKLNKIIIAQKNKFPGKDDKIRAGVYAEAKKRGFTDEQIARQVNRRLVEDPIKKAIKEEMRNVKSDANASILLDKDKFANEIAARVSKNTDFTADQVLKVISDRETDLSISSSTAAKLFAGKEHQKETYTQELRKQGKSTQAFNEKVSSHEKRNSKTTWQVYHALAGRLERTSLSRLAYGGYGKLVDVAALAEYSVQDGNKVQSDSKSAIDKINGTTAQDEILRQRMISEREALLKSMEDNKNALELDKVKSQIASDNTADEEAKAKKLREALEQYEKSKQKLALWKELNDAEYDIKMIEGKPEAERDQAKLNNLKQKKNNAEEEMKKL